MQRHEIRPIREVLKKYYLEALEACNGNRAHVAALLGITVKTSSHYANTFGAPAGRTVWKGSGEKKSKCKESYRHNEPTHAERDDWYNRDFY